MSTSLEFLCLSCGHRINAYKTNTTKPRQCPQCWSYFLIDLETYNQCRDAVQIAQNGALFPGVNAIITILTERGFRFRPRETLQLLLLIERDIQSNR